MTQTKGRDRLPEQPLSDEALSARRKYYREYYKKNPQKRRQWIQSHWERLAQQEGAKQDDN